MKKKIIASVIAALLSTTALADTASINPDVAGMGLLQNEWVRAGINLNTGTFGSGGNTSPGLLFDPTGTGTFNPSFDYLTPGSPFDGFSVKIDGTNYANNNEGDTAITKTGEGLGPNAIVWNGQVADKFQIDMNYSLLAGQPFVNGIATINMLTGATSLSFAKFIDPDSQGMPGDSSSTDNVLGYGVIPSTNVAFSEATVSRYALGIYTTDTNVTAGVNGWETDADAYNGTNYYKPLLDADGNPVLKDESRPWMGYELELDADGNPIPVNYGNSDDTIGISWTWSNVSAGDILEASYAYIFGPSAFEAAEDAITGGAGGGNTSVTSSWGTLTDVGSATDAAESGASGGGSTPTVVSTSDPVPDTGSAVVEDTVNDALPVLTASITTTTELENGTQEVVTVSTTTPYTRRTTTPTIITTTYSDGSTTTTAGDDIVTVTSFSITTTEDTTTTTVQGIATYSDASGTNTVVTTTSEDGLVTTTTTTTPVTRTFTTPVTQTVENSSGTTTTTLDPIVTTSTLEIEEVAVATTTVTEAQNTALPILTASITHHEASDDGKVQTIDREKTTSVTTPMNVTTTVTTVTTTTNADGAVSSETDATSTVAIRNDVEITVTDPGSFVGRIDQMSTANDMLSMANRSLSFDGVNFVRDNSKMDNGMSGGVTGITIGGTRDLENGWSIGAGVGKLSTSVRDVGSADVDTTLVNLHGGRSMDLGTINFGLTHAMNDYTSSRTIGDFANTSKTAGTDTWANVTFTGNGEKIRPVVGITSGVRKMDGYTEAGSIQSARTVADTTEHYTFGTIGAQATLTQGVNIEALHHTDGVNSLALAVNKEIQKDTTVMVKAGRSMSDLGDSNSIMLGLVKKF